MFLNTHFSTKSVRRAAWVLTLVCLVPFLGHAQVYELRCEGLPSPLGVDNTHPHFSWKNRLNHNGQIQAAYEIEVASDTVCLRLGKADLWRRGKVTSANQVMVPYGGKPLASRQLCYWRVRTWDERGNATEWSQPERFAIGPIDGIGGKFIGCQQFDTLTQTPIFRKHVNLKSMGTTMAHINSVGYHELYVNGNRVGDKVLQPAVSQVDKRTLIVTYDITPYLHTGDNLIEIHVGQGWGRIFHSAAALRAEIAQLNKGRWRTLSSTDETWQTASSCYSYTGSWQPLQFGGERVDARFQPEWHPAVEVKTVGGMASPQMFEGNRIVDTVEPVSVTRQDDGSLLVDFGRVVMGWFWAEFAPSEGTGKAVSLEPGAEVSMEYLDHDGAVPPHTESDLYIARGSGKEVFRNRFHSHSFRFVRIRGAAVVSARALQISAVDPKVGATFACSDSSLNAIHDMVKYTLSCLTFGGYMVDCPHLERMGYGGDGNSSTMTLQTMFDVQSTYANWMTAWADAVGPDGDLPYVAPAFRTGGGLYWSGFVVKAPWRTYVNYGDRTLIERHYDAMCRWLAFVERNSPDGLPQPWADTERRMWFLGDWLAPKGVDVGGESVLHVSGCFLAECLADMEQMARLLGRDAEAMLFAQRREALIATIHRRFYHPESHTYANGTPLDQSYALLAGVPPDSVTRSAVRGQLISDAYSRYNSHIAVGLMGVPVFTEWCIRDRQAELMATLLRQPDYPGYLDMIARGATTTWESWDGERSRVHNCYNGIGLWFYQAMAGIRPDSSAPGYRHFFVDPQPVSDVAWVRATKPTPYGDISVAIEGGTMKLTVPVGTTAMVFPNTDREQTLPAGVWEIR